MGRYKRTAIALLKKEANIPPVTDALSTMLRLLREELEEASWLIEARSRMELVELYNKK